MTHRIVFATSMDQIERKHKNIVDRYYFGDGGCAAKIEVAEDDLVALNDNEYWDPEMEFKLRTSPAISTDSNDWASLEDVRTLHETPGDRGLGEGVTWVVNDSGIDDDHPVFKDGQVVERKDLTGTAGTDSVGHGTAVAGQIARLAPSVDLIDLRIFGDNGSTSMDTILRAYEWLTKNADRYDGVNMSWGAQQRVPQLDNIHNSLVDHGVRDVVAAGNTGGKGGSPATAERAFSAGSCDKKGNMSNFSSHNPKYENPEVAAIGENVRLARAAGTSMGEAINDNWTVASGTSFSAPHLSGMCAKYLDEVEDLSPVDLRSPFVSTADNIPNVPEDGAGLVKYRPALDSPESEPVETATANVWTFMGYDTIFIKRDWLDNGNYTVKRRDIEKAFEPDDA